MEDFALKHTAEATVRKMALGKVSGCVLMAVCLFAMANASETQEENPLKGPENALSFVGSNATFTCISPLRSCVNMTWHKDVKFLFVWNIFTPIDVNDHHFRDRYTVQNTTLGCKLTITDVQMDDTGSIYCEIQISSRSFDSRIAELTVIRPQEENPLKGPENLLSFVGTNATFTCVSPLRSCVNMTWHKESPVSFWWDLFIPIDDYHDPHLRNRCILENTTLGCKLTVTDVQLDDTGSLYCEIKISSRSFDSRIAELIVINTQDNPLKGPFDLLSAVGTNAAFTCVSPWKNCLGLNWYKHIPGTDPETIFSEENGIYLRDKYIVDNSSTVGCTLIVTNVELKDTGSIICEIQISGRPFEGRIAELIVIKTKEENPLKGPENSLSLVGTNAIFSCVSPFRSCVNLTWHKGHPLSFFWDIFIPINDNYTDLRDRCIVENTTLGCKLTVTNVQLDDTGSVYCEIQIAGTAFKSRIANLIVINEQNMGLLKGPENSSSVVGSNATFFCVSPSRDCGGMTWYKNIPGEISETIYHPEDGVDLTDKYIVENSTVGCKLIVTNVRFIDAGFFICEKKIGINSLIGTAYLTVIKPRRENPLKGPKNSVSFVGSNATFTCVSLSRNCFGMTWYKHTLGRDQETVFSEPRGIYPIDKYIVETSTEGCRLIVTNLETKDIGSVSCQLQDLRNFVEEHAFLIVTNTQNESPLVGPENSSSVVGSNAAFTCVSPLRNCLGLNWYRHIPGTDRETIFSVDEDIYLSDEYVLENITGGCQLTVKSVGTKDAGPVICEFLTGSNFTGTAYLTVIRLRPENALKGPNNSFSVVGSNATFTCVSPFRGCDRMSWHKYMLGRNPVTVFSEPKGIYHRYKYIVEDSAVGCKLIVTDLKTTDTGSVICQYLDRVARIDREGTAYLFVTYEIPKNCPLKGPENSFRFVGSNATFTCISPSRDCAGMTWYKHAPRAPVESIYRTPYGVYRKDKHIVENSSVGCQLIVTSVEMNDTGSYYCEVLIGSTLLTATAELFVINEMRHSPLQGPKDSLSAVGSNATFICFSPSKDCGGMTWYKHITGSDRETIFSEHDGIYRRDKYIVENFKGICILIVRNVEMADTGSIICEIVISRISFEGTAQLTVTSDDATSKLKRQGTLQLGKAMDPLTEEISAMKAGDSPSSVIETPEKKMHKKNENLNEID